MKDALAIFRFLHHAQLGGEPTVLITLTCVTGSGARAPGSHMAVSGTGASAGSFSGGCIEAAVIAEALDVLAAGKARTVRFGVGSPYIDIRLPCGGGIDLLFTPQPDSVAVERAVACLEARMPIAAGLCEDAGLTIEPATVGMVTGAVGARFVARHDPDLRLVLIGQGAEPAALLRMARAYGAEVSLLTPDLPGVEAAQAQGIPATRLVHHGRSEALVVDRWTAVIFLFHDHDWETELLRQALEGPALLIGAMGSRRTHAERCRRLRELGVSAAEIERIVGPIGLIHAVRDPDTLAISVMAQVVAAYDEKYGVTKVANVTDHGDDGEANSALRELQASAGGDIR